MYYPTKEHIVSEKEKQQIFLNATFQCFEPHKQNSIYLHHVDVEAEIGFLSQNLGKYKQTFLNG